MATTTSSLFERRHTHLPAVKDVLVATLVLALIAGFFVHAMKPVRSEAAAPAAVAVI